VDRVLKLAKSLNVWAGLNESVRAEWLPKDKGGYRLICKPGPLRKAQQIMLRDVLMVMEIDNECDFTHKGAGGEVAFRDEVIKNLCGGYRWWWTPDVINCFPSIRPGHLGWLPIDRILMRRVVYLPGCAAVVVAKPEDPAALLAYLKVTHLDLPVDGTSSPSEQVVSFTHALVRRGLPMGSCLSVLLARAFLGRELREGLKDLDVRCLCWIDDLYVGARKHDLVSQAKAAMTKRLLGHSAGPIRLHDDGIQDVKQGRLKALGYDFEPGKGYGGTAVHVKPGRKRVDRHKARLAKKLEAAQPGADLFEIGERYARQWFGGNRAWTKVPYHSRRLCLDIAATYVDDWINKIPMGGWSLESLSKGTTAKNT
jgi:hypothetical protein